MKTSHNVLVIESLSTKPKETPTGLFLCVSELKAIVKINDPETGRTIKSYELTCNDSGTSSEVALQRCIQNFFDGNIAIDCRFHDCGHVNCTPDFRNIHSLDIQLSSPFKELFERLFDASKWTMAKLQLN